MSEKLGIIKRLSLAWELLGGSTKALTQYPAQNPSLPYYSWDGITYPGSRIDYAREVGDLSASSLVMAAVRWLGNVLPEAPLMVKENKGAKGDSQEMPAHPLLELFRRPNPYYSGSNLWKAFAFSWITSGNVFFIKVWNAAGTEVVQLWYEPHWSITPRWINDNKGAFISGNDDPKAFINYYELDRQGKKIRLEVSDVVHFRDGIDPQNPRMGLSPMASILRELFTDNQAAHYSARIFKSMGIIPYVIAPKDGVDVSDEDLRAVKQSLIRQTTSDKVAEPIALGGAVELLKPPAFDPKQMEIKIARRLPEERFAAVVGIPIQVLGFGAGLERSTYSNMSQAYEGAYESFLIPLDRHIDEELTAQLLPDFESESSIKNRYVRHDFSQVRALQEDEDSKSKRVIGELSGGIITLNESRSMRGMEPLPNGDVFYIPSGMSVVPKDDVGKTPEPVIQPTDAPMVPAKSVTVPPADVIDEAENWWDENAPVGAKDLIRAKVKSNGGEVIA